MIFCILQHSALQDLTRLDESTESTAWMRVCTPHLYLLHHWVIFLGGFSFPSQSCTQKSSNHLMMLQFHQSEKPWNKKYSYISFIPFTFVGWTSLNVLARKVFTILAESISQTMCPFSKFLSCISLHRKRLGVTRPNEVWNLFPRPHLGAWWWLVTSGCFSDDFLLVDKAPQHLDVSSLWASSTGIGQRFGKKWRIENLSTHLAT